MVSRVANFSATRRTHSSTVMGRKRQQLRQPLATWTMRPCEYISTLSPRRSRQRFLETTWRVRNVTNRNTISGHELSLPVYMPRRSRARVVKSALRQSWKDWNMVSNIAGAGSAPLERERIWPSPSNVESPVPVAQLLSWCHSFLSSTYCSTTVLTCGKKLTKFRC